MKNKSVSKMSNSDNPELPNGNADMNNSDNPELPNGNADMRSVVGQIIETDIARIKALKNFWDRNMINLERVIERYNVFKDLIGPFTSDTLADIMDNRGREIFKNFSKAVHAQLFERNGEVLYNVIVESWNALPDDPVAKQYQPLEDAIQSFLSLVDRSEAGQGTPPMRLEDIHLVEGKPAINIEAITKRYQSILESEKQVEIYDLLIQAKEAYNKANSVLLEIASPFEIPILHQSSGLFYASRDGFLEIHVGNLNRIK